MDIGQTEEDGVIAFTDSLLVPISYDQCCLWNYHRVSPCGASSHRRILNVSMNFVSLSTTINRLL